MGPKGKVGQTQKKEAMEWPGTCRQMRRREYKQMKGLKRQLTGRVLAEQAKALGSIPNTKEKRVRTGLKHGYVRDSVFSPRSQAGAIPTCIGRHSPRKFTGRNL